MPYQKTSNGNEVTFQVQPEKDVDPIEGSDKVLSGCGFVFLGFLIGGLLVSSGSKIGIGAGVIMIVAVLVNVYKIFVNKNYVTSKERVPKTFIVSPDYLKVDGKTYTRENIQRIKVRNFWKNVNINNPNHSVNYKVDIESNGTPVTIASGLNEPTASAIVIDVCNILGMEISN